MKCTLLIKKEAPKLLSQKEAEKIMKQARGFKSIPIVPSINHEDFISSIEDLILSRAKQGHKDLTLEIPANNLYPYIFHAITELQNNGYRVDFCYRTGALTGEIYITWDEWGVGF